MDVDEYAKLKIGIALDIVILAVKSGISITDVLEDVEEETKKIIKDVVE